MHNDNYNTSMVIWYQGIRLAPITNAKDGYTVSSSIKYV